MISPSLESLRILLHVLSAGVWVAGQIVVGGIVPSLRKASPDAVPHVARAFARVAWPAMVVVVVTGLWALASEQPSEQSGQWLVTFGLKLLLVGVSVASAAAHSVSRSRLIIAIGGAAGLLAGLGAFYLGVLIAHAG